MKVAKDLETKHFKRLLKNAQYIFPKQIESVDPYHIKQQIMDSFTKDFSSTKI